MSSGLSQIANSIAHGGVVDGRHKRVAYGAYGMLTIAMVAVESVLFARSGASIRLVFTATFILLALYQAKSLYFSSSQPNNTAPLEASVRFSQLGSTLWVLTLYPWADAQLNVLVMAVVVFQASVFVSLARFLVDKVRATLIVMAALLLCIYAGAPTDLSTAMMICCMSFIGVLWLRLMVNRTIYKKVLDLGLLTEESNKTLQQKQALLHREARTDQMTRIGNRRAFFEYCARAEDTEDKDLNIVSIVAILDLDNFKQVNDVHGHQAGDQLIFETASRLERALAPDGQVFRLGGDEFVIVYPSDSNDAFSKLQRLTDIALSYDLKHGGKNISVNWSMGAASVACQEPDFTEALSRADKALYKAKTVRRNHMHVFCEDDEEEMRVEAMLVSHTESVLSKGALQMYGQPIYAIDDHSQTLYAVEALLRVKDPSGTPIRPDVFVKRAALARHCDQLTYWTLLRAIEMVQKVDSAALLTFNLSPEQFVDPGLCEVLGSIIGQTNFDPHSLVIELSEKTLLSDLQCTNTTLTALKNFGVQLALDDFGSQNTGFSTLIDFDFNIIKTDPKLLMSAMTNKRSAVMFRKIVEMCDALEIKCIAEGVETKREYDFARRVGCNYLQGYYYGYPSAEPQIDTFSLRQDVIQEFG